MTEQRRLSQHYRGVCSYSATVLYVASMLWVGLLICVRLFSWAGAAQLLPVVTAVAQLAKAATAAVVAVLLYNEEFALEARLMRMGAAAERSLVLAAWRAAAGSGGQQPSTPSTP